MTIHYLLRVIHIFRNANTKKTYTRPVVVNQYTQGEWSIDPKASLRITNGKTTICSIPYGNSQSLEEEQANTRLIANAPKLHQFAEMLFDMLNGKGEDSIVLDALTKVLNDINPKD